LTSCLFIPQDLSSNPADIAVTLDGLSHIVTPELSRDIAPELIAMLNHSRPNIRKRAILALYKTLVKYPEAITLARARLEEKLDDPDPCEYDFSCRWSSYKIHSAAVTAATVNVLCELARRNPKDYLSLAPKLFYLLTSSTNNWMLIKIVKLVQNSLELCTPRILTLRSSVHCRLMNPAW
jgi:AP-3 complex subunit delta-1